MHFLHGRLARHVAVKTSLDIFSFPVFLVVISKFSYSVVSFLSIAIKLHYIVLLIPPIGFKSILLYRHYKFSFNTLYKKSFKQ